MHTYIHTENSPVALIQTSTHARHIVTKSPNGHALVGIFNRKIKYLRKLIRLGMTPELLRRICACKAS